MILRFVVFAPLEEGAVFAEGVVHHVKVVRGIRECEGRPK